jgi:hypothetical protein
MGWATSDGFWLDNIVIDKVSAGALYGTIASTITFYGTITNTEEVIPGYIYTQGANNVVTFTDTSTNATSWLWNFGDGTTSTSSVATHTFGYSSTPIDVILTVSNDTSVATTPQGYSPIKLLSTIGAKATNVDIVTKFGQIETCDLQYINITPEQASENLGINFPFFFNPIDSKFLDGATVLFTGFVKRVTKQDNKPIWDVHAEGTASYLRDKYNEIDKIYTTTSASTIINNLIGATAGGVWDTIYDTSNIPTLDYHITAGSVLNHCINICNMCGWEWDCYRRYIGSASSPIWSSFIFRVSDHLGSTQTATTLKTFDTTTPATLQTPNVVNLDIHDNTDKIYTAILANGISPSASNMYCVISANTFNMEPLISGESYLADTITATATVIPLIDASGYPSNGDVLIDDELIHYPVKDGNNLGMTSGNNGCTRQPATLGGSSHNIYADVLLTSYYEFNSIVDYSQDNIIWVGMEQISFDNRTTASISDLTRGYNDTPKYSHRAGVFVRDGGSWATNTQPATGSPVDLYGVIQNSIPANGVNTQNGVDLITQRELIKTMDKKVYGTLTLRSTDPWCAPIHNLQDDHIHIGSVATLGSNIVIYDKEGKSFNTRILGIHYNQFKPPEITYGSIDEFILDDFAKLDTVNMNSMISNNNAYKTSVTSVSTVNNKLVYVKLPDGTSDWVEVV